MHDPIFQWQFTSSVVWTLTGWKLVGYIGISCFALRWIVQMAASAKQREVTVPKIFWTITLLGAAFQLTYFALGRNDSVGILASLFALLVATYNLGFLFFQKRRSHTANHKQPKNLVANPEAGDSLHDTRQDH
jgi:lipid-A-disaccharide synthase-like uncharacterized protein